jgi:hypothetical protein
MKFPSIPSADKSSSQTQRLNIFVSFVFLANSIDTIWTFTESEPSWDSWVLTVHKIKVNTTNGITPAFCIEDKYLVKICNYL